MLTLNKGFVLAGSLMAILSGAADIALTDAQIAEVMRVANEGEIDFGKAARRKAKNPAVKRFADKMVKEHSDNKDEGRKITKRHDIDMDDSEVAKALKQSNESKLNEIKKNDDSAFDRAYIQSQVDVHQQLADDLRNKYIPAAKNPSFKEYLETTRKHVEAHLSEAKQIQSGL